MMGAKYPISTWYDNDTEKDATNDRLILDLDWEKDVAGTIPDLYHFQYFCGSSYISSTISN